MFWRWLGDASRARACAMLVIVIVAVASFTRVAGAQGRGAPAPKPGPTVVPPGSTPVLTFESDDAEEQADAFTAALRARIKAEKGWVLSESTFSLGILTSALKCRLDAPCLQRVADQLRTDKFFWGRVSRVGKTQVSVEAHYWQRGKHDSVVKESYSDDLRDPNGEGLKKVASRIFERLTGTLTTGTVAIKAGKAGGQVIIDGALAGELSGGQATLELKAGSYAIEVRKEGFLPVRQVANVVVGAETQLTFDLVAPAPPPEPPPPEKPLPVRRIASYGLIGAGGVAGVVGIVQLIRWLGLKSDLEDLKKDQYGVPQIQGRPEVKIKDPCLGHPDATDAAKKRMSEACERGPDGESISTVGIIAGSIGAALVGAGVVLLVTDAADKAPRKGEHEKPRFSVIPSLGPREGSLRLAVTF